MCLASTKFKSTFSLAYWLPCFRTGKFIPPNVKVTIKAFLGPARKYLQTNNAAL